jgi:putative hemolysin
VFTTAVLLFTEIIPKTLGVTYAVQLATPVAIGIRMLTVTLRPLVWASERMSRALRGSHKVPVTSVEEIRLLASLGRNEGVVGLRTAQVIEGAARLRDLSARDILLPRHKVVFLSGSHSRADVLAILRQSGHSRFPFTPTGELDDASHVVLAKQLMSWMFAHPGEEIAWHDVTREPIIVPEAMTAPMLLKTFKDARRHLAIVVDEYGSVQGIVTLEDVLEELVGEILDEYDPLTEEITRSPDGSLRVVADLDLRRLCRHLGIDWEPQGEVATIAGLLMETLERMPAVGDSIDWRGYRLTVTGADARRTFAVLVERLSDSDA